MAKYGILVDMNRCLGCKACALSCKQENKVPVGVSWLKVEDEVIKGAKGPEMHSFPMACLHCGEPACAKVCPVGAIITEKDKTVQRDEKKCVGCRYCVNACPFGQSKFNEKDQKAEKCNLCKERQARGEAPACTANCPTKARVAVPPDKLQAEAEKRVTEAKKMGKDLVFYAGQNVGGTQVGYVVPKATNLQAGPEGKDKSPAVGVWKDVVQPIGKWGLGGVIGAVLVAAAMNSGKKGDK